MSYLEIKNFIKSFDKPEVLKDISFTMEKGEVLSVIGSSGSGKTTLLRCLNFLESPDGGKMVLDGEQLIDADGKTKESEKALREKRLNFGLVFQSFNLTQSIIRYDYNDTSGGASPSPTKSEADILLSQCSNVTNRYLQSSTYINNITISTIKALPQYRQRDVLKEHDSFLRRTPFQYQR